MAGIERLRWLMSDLEPRSTTSRALTWGAGVWGASAALHLVVFVVDGGGWAGPTSWRKPIVFSVSIAAMLWAFGWVIDRLPPSPRLARWLAWTFLAAASMEVGLISMQTWRGNASHFNEATSLDGTVFALMGVMVGIMSLALVTLFAWTLVRRPEDGPTLLAVVAGMSMIVLGLGLGQWLIQLGTAYVESTGAVPATVVSGDAGVPKFPHAVAFHGIQVFALVIAMTRRQPLGRRRLLVRLVTSAYGSLLVLAVLQSVAGRAPLDVGAVSGVLTVIATLVLGGTLAVATRAWWVDSAVAPRDGRISLGG